MLRQLLQSSLFALVAALPLSAQADDGSGWLKVVAVQPTRIADILILGSGFDAGLRQGMACRVTRNGVEIAEILLVEIRLARASALIIGQTSGQPIRAGDTATVKILKT